MEQVVDDASDENKVDLLAREKELQVVLGVLHFLALENLRDANILCQSYVSFIKVRIFIYQFQHLMLGLEAC